MIAVRQCVGYAFTDGLSPVKIGIVFFISSVYSVSHEQYMIHKSVSYK